MFDDFDVHECEASLRDETPNLMAYHAKLSMLADNADWSESKRQAYFALSSACGLYFQPEYVNNPLEAMLRLPDGRTSFTIDCFSEEHLAFFESIVSSLQIAALRARIADILWLRRRKDRHLFAVMAIKAYLETSLSPGNWISEGIGEQWMRGTILALQLGKMEEVFHGKHILDHLFDCFLSAPSHEVPYQLFLERIMRRLEHIPSFSQDHKRRIAEKLDETASVLERSNQYAAARDVLDAVAHWAQDLESVRSRIAQSFENEIQSLEPQLAGQHLNVQLLCNQLIAELRRIPEKRRAEFRVAGRLAWAQGVLVRCREHTTEDLHLAQIGPIDISDLVERTKKKFHGLEFVEALKCFACISPQDIQALRAETEERIKKHPLQHLFDRYSLSEDGRIVAVTSGLFSSPKNQKEAVENEKTIGQATLDTYDIHIQVKVQGVLMPAYRTILEEHRFSFAHAMDIVRQSPLIPPGRHYAFARILEFGFHGDFAMAMYILAPEIENLIRFHLKGFGVTTTKVEEPGIEVEVGMGALMDFQETAECLGHDLAWELKALFCDPGGPNLRNSFAHGLETDTLGQSYAAMYAWWLVFRMIMLLRPKEI